MSPRDIRRVHCTCISLLLFILLHFPTAFCFASLKKHENAAKRLCHAWDLQETDSIRKAIQNCLELYEAIENFFRFISMAYSTRSTRSIQAKTRGHDFAASALAGAGTHVS